MSGLKVIAFAAALCASAFTEQAWALYVDISAPTSGATLTANTSITITADAFPGTYLVPIVKVDFFAGDTLIGTTATYPYGITWSNVPSGTYTLTAVVTDTDGDTDESDEVLITVTSGTGGGAQIYYVEPDHLNTARMVANQAGTTVWRWDQGEPFGTSEPNQDPDADGTLFDFPLRFPGQFFDKETNLAYNYFRDYDPATGRYTRSDPIGLKSGINTYAYANGNPVSNYDPSGLECASVGAFIYCAYPDGGLNIRLPKPSGAPDFMGADNFVNFLKYHKYDVQVSLNGADEKCVMQKLIENPTPGDPSPATPDGTRNNAKVFGIDNMVTSYLTSDLDTHNPVVVNLADSGSAFPPGYVARTVSNGVAHTYGEGLSQVQAIPGGQAFGNWYYWKRQMQDIVKECTCRK